MQPGRGLIQDIHRATRCLPGEFPRQFDTLCLTTRQRCSGLTKVYIAQTNIVQRLQLIEDGRYFREKAHRLFHRHVQYFGDILAFIMDLQRLAIVALALTHLAGHIHIRQEVHFNFYDALTLTGFAPSAFHIQ